MPATHLQRRLLPAHHTFRHSHLQRRLWLLQAVRRRLHYRVSVWGGDTKAEPEGANGMGCRAPRKSCLAELKLRAEGFLVQLLLVQRRVLRHRQPSPATRLRRRDVHRVQGPICHLH